MASLEEKAGNLLEGLGGGCSPRASSSLSGSSKVNKAPQDFVVAGGNTYKVIRSSYDKQEKPVSSGSRSNSGTTNGAGVNATSILDGAGVVQGRLTPTLLQTASRTSSAGASGEEITSLRNALNEAETCVSRQAARIEELERYLLTNADKLGGMAALQTTLGIKAVPAHDLGGSNKARLGLAARRRAESSQSTEYGLHVNTKNESPDREKDPSPSSVLTASTFAPISEADLITPTFANTGGAGIGIGSEGGLSPGMLRRSHSDGEFVGLQRSDASGSLQGSGSGKVPPKGLAARLALGSEERRRLASIKRMSGADTNSKKEGQDGKGADRDRERDGKGAGSSANRSRSSTLSRPESAGVGDADLLVSDNNNSPFETPKLSRSSSTGSGCGNQMIFNSSGPLYQWENIQASPRSRSADPKLHLFIAHDNPQLGNTVHVHLRTDPSGSMGFMMETKYLEAGKEVTCFIVGEISYSGPFEGIQNASFDTEQRGSLCLVCTNMRGYKTDIKSYPSQPRGDIIEIDLSMGTGDTGFGSKTVAAHEHVLATEEQLVAFLKPCVGRVDVILDPSHTGVFYPYWEGRRKMAPQFRSKGVGYLRLGDDMSNYGSAFLSLDAGKTFLDDGATSIVGDSKGSAHNKGFFNTYPGPMGMSGGTPSNSNVRQALFSSVGGARSDSRGSQRSIGGGDDADAIVHNSRSNSNSMLSDAQGGAGGRDDDMLPSGEGGSSCRSAKELHMRQGEIKEILALLRDQDLKWGPRSQHLARLRDLGDSYGADAYTYTGSSAQEQADTTAKCGKGATDLISVLTDTILRQNNPQVLRAAVSCLRTVGASAAANATCSVAWRALLLEVFHLLRATSKTVFEEAKDTLDYLHSSAGKNPTLTLTQLTPMFSDIFAGPRGKGTPRASGASDKSSVGGASNTKNVVAWFVQAAQHELSAGLQAFVSIHTAEFIPSCYERIDTATTLSRCQHLLQHREETTREAVVGLIANIISLDAVQQSTDRADLLACVKQAKEHFRRFESASVVDSASCLAAMEHHLLKMTSEKCGLIVQDVSRSSARMYEKLLPVLVKQLGMCSNMLKSGKGSSELTSGNISINSSSSSPAHAQPPTPVHHVRDRYANLPSSRGSSRGDVGSREGGSRVSSAGAARSSPGTTSSADTSLVKNKPISAAGLKVKTVASNSRDGTPQQPSPRSMEAQKRAAMTSPTMRSSPNTLPPHSPVDVSALKQRINDQWFEVSMVLRTIPNTETGYRMMSDATCKESVDSFSNGLASVAEKCGMPRGKLLRIILPFDENTSSHDQSQAGSSSHSAAAQELAAQLKKRGDSPRVLDRLRDQAVSIRKTIRVKMADEADLRQALLASQQLQTFCNDVEVYSRETGKTPVNIIGGLE